MRRNPRPSVSMVHEISGGPPDERNPITGLPPGEYLTLFVNVPIGTSPILLAELGINVMSQGSDKIEHTLTLARPAVVVHASSRPMSFNFEAEAVRTRLKKANVSVDCAIQAYAKIVKHGEVGGGLALLSDERRLPLNLLIPPVSAPAQPYQTNGDAAQLIDFYSRHGYLSERSGRNQLTLQIPNSEGVVRVPSRRAVSKLTIVSPTLHFLTLELPADPCDISLTHAERLIHLKLRIDRDDEDQDLSRLTSLSFFQMSLPDDTIVELGAHAAKVNLTVGRIHTLRVASYCEVSIRQRTEMKSRTDRRGRDRTQVQRLEVDKSLTNSFRLAGDVDIRVVVVESAHFSADIDGDVSIGRVVTSLESPQLKEPVWVEIEGQNDRPVGIDWLPPGSTIESRLPLQLGRGVAFGHNTWYPWWEERDGQVVYPYELEDTAASGSLWSIDRLTTVDVPELHLWTTVNGLSMTDHGFATRLLVKSEARAFDVAGGCILECEPTAELTGHRFRPVIVYRAGKCAQARIEHVDVSWLPITDIRNLAEASIFVPSKRNLRLNRRDRSVDLKSGARTDTPANTPGRKWQQERFMWQLSQVVRDVSAPASLVREIEYRHFVARRQALRLSTERVLLTLYSFVGYGRRCLRPILLFVLLCMALAALVIALPGAENEPVGWVALADASIVGWLRETITLVMQPLALLELVKDSRGPLYDSLGGQLTAALCRGLGVVLLGFSLLALRRLFTYPEDKTRATPPGAAGSAARIGDN